ncbi:MAG: PQQ-binding-like beta-propeller repeat protein [Planctomycetaceae bacterium]|nr:PQQ-binding-like beta-propeller repeat protein [Planctomycetaceae bacterium]
MRLLCPQLVAVAMLTGALCAAQPAAPRKIDFFPPQWTALNIVWQPTWEATVAANSEQAWSEELSADKSLAQAAGQIVALRRIALHKALMERFPREKDKHLQAYRTIAMSYQQLGMGYWRSYWGWKLVHDFPARKEQHAEAYGWMMQWPYAGSYFSPDAAQWKFAIDDVLALHARGVIADDSPLLAQAAGALAEMSVQEDRYDVFAGELDRIERLGKTVPRFNEIAQNLLLPYGHFVAAAKWADRAGNPNSFALLTDAPTGSIEGLIQNQELQTRWEALTQGDKLSNPAGALDAAAAQEILDRAAGSEAFMKRDESHYVSFQVMAAAALDELTPQRLEPLRAAQFKGAARIADAVRLTGSGDDLALGLRQYPWAANLHELEVDFAEQALRQGRCQWAIAAFRDAARRGGDPALRRAAQAGLWMALAQSSGADFQTAMDAVPNETLMPWFGGTIPAGKLKSQLLAQAAAADQTRSLALNALARRRISLPPDWPTDDLQGPPADQGAHSPWPVQAIATTGAALIVSGPGRIARYDSGRPTPVWTYPPGEASQEPPSWDAAAAWRYLGDMRHFPFSRRPVAVGPAAVCDDGSVAFTLTLQQGRWMVTALNLATGREAWSTRDRSDCRDLNFMSEPAVVDGRVYVLAAPAEIARDAGQGPGRDAGTPVLLHLACLASEDGQLLWKRDIGWQPHTLLDLAQRSAAVTVHDGAVYCSTNMGLIARCDVRDGMVEWVHGYASAIQARGCLSVNFARQGSRAIVAGRKLLIAPRDHTGILAFDTASGRGLWETVLTPSDRLLGVTGSAVIGANERWLAAVDLASGRQLWCREFRGGIAGQGAVCGGEVAVISGGRVHRISAQTGRDVESASLATGPNAEPIMLGDGSIVEVEAPPLAPEPPRDGAGGGLQLPLKCIWQLNAPRATLVLPPQGQADGFMAVVSGRRLACLKTHPKWQIAWQRLLERQPQAVVAAGDRVIAATLHELRAYDAGDGRLLWSLELGFLAGTLGGDAATIFAVTATAHEPHVAVIDAASGKLLWTRSLALGARFSGGIWDAALHRQGQAGVDVVINTLWGDVGWRWSLVTFEAATGAIRDIRRFMPDDMNWSGYASLDGDSMRFMGHDARVHVAPRGGGGDQAAAWETKFHLNAWNHFRHLAEIRWTGKAIYANAVDQLFEFDLSTRRQTVYTPPKDARMIQAVIHDFRPGGEAAWVVSGVTGQMRAVGGQPAPPPFYSLADSRMYVDMFDPATGRHLARQELPDALCGLKDLAGFDTRARILDNGVVVADPRAVRIYASGAAAAKPAPRATPAKPPSTEWFYKSKWGVFLFYAPTLQRIRTPQEWDATVAAFDAPALARQLKECGAGYLMIPVRYHGDFPLAPNSVIEKDRPGLAPKRDLIADLAGELDKQGIALVLYCTAGAGTGDIGEAAGSAAVIEEWSRRYGTAVKAWWIAGINDAAVLQRMLAAAARAGNPDALVGFGREGVPRRNSPYEDFTASFFADAAKLSCPGRRVDGLQWHAVLPLGATWGAQRGAAVRWQGDRPAAITETLLKRGGVITWDAKAMRSGLIEVDCLPALKAIGRTAATFRR